MSFIINKLLGESIIQITLNNDFDVRDDTPLINQELRTLLEGDGAPVILIADFRPALGAMSVDSITEGANLAARGEAAFFHHPLIEEIVFIAKTNLMKLVAKGLRSNVFGGLAVEVFETPEDALTYSRQKIAGG